MQAFLSISLSESASKGFGASTGTDFFSVTDCLLKGFASWFCCGNNYARAVNKFFMKKIIILPKTISFYTEKL